MAIKDRVFSNNGFGLKTTIIWFWDISGGQRKRILYSCLIGLLEVGCNLAFVWASKSVIDIATGAIEGNLINAGIIAFLLLSGQLTFAGLDMWLSGRMPVDNGNNLRRRLFNHLLRTRWESLEEYHSGDILNRVSRDIEDVVRLLTISVPAVFITAIQLIASLVFLYNLDSSLAWLLALIIPIFLFISKLYVRRMKKYNRQIRESDSKIQSVIQESIQHHTIIKAMERRANRISLLDNLQSNLRGKVIKRTRLSLFSRMIMSIGFSGGYLLVFLWGAFRLSRGEISFGTMTAFLQLIGRVQRPAYDLTQLLPSFIAAYTAAERLMELESLPVEQDADSVLFECPVGLKFENVSFAYKDSEQHVLKNLNLYIPPCSKTAIVGETGVGKTTLVRLILSLVSPDEGNILLTTNHKTTPVSSHTRVNFTYVPQGNTLFSGTIRDNLLIGNPDVNDERMREVLQIACADFVDSLPDGLNTFLGERGGGLSEGQAQRIAIARALLGKGRILLFDEITSALDRETEALLLSNLSAYCKEKTMIFITHHKELTEICDRVYKIH